ncbi:hypothetical protein ACSQ67_023494 [Phaseolus vulgaris]
MLQRRKKDLSYSSSSSSSDISMPPFLPIRTTSEPSFKSFILILSILLNLYLLFLTWAPSYAPLTSSTLITTVSPTTRRHLLFSVASSSLSWPRRLPYLRLWYSPNSTRALAFLDKPPPLPLNSSSSSSSPPEAVDRNETDVRWFVFGDDDTVFFVDNVVRALARYDHRRWFYVGSNSESYDQNVDHSFEMAFGGGGFAISCSLAEVLARVLDSCLRRYANLYGSDSRIYSCVAELGVGLTHEPGFHQVGSVVQMPHFPSTNLSHLALQSMHLLYVSLLDCEDSLKMERKEVGSVNKARMLERGKNKVEEDVGNALKKESGFVNQSDKVDRVTLNSHTTYAEGKIEAQSEDGRELTAEVGLGSGPNRKGPELVLEEGKTHEENGELSCGSEENVETESNPPPLRILRECQPQRRSSGRMKGNGTIGDKNKLKDMKAY